MQTARKVARSRTRTPRGLVAKSRSPAVVMNAGRDSTMTIMTTTSTKVDVEEIGGVAAGEKAGERVVRDEGVIRGTHATTGTSGTTTMATMTAAAVGTRRTGCGQPEMLTRGDRRREHLPGLGRCFAI